MMTPEQMRFDFGAVQDDVDIDAFFAVLSNPRRRFLLVCLDRHSRPLALADAAAELTSWECETPRDQLSTDQVRSRYIALHHVHVPQMVAADCIEHNRDRNTIELGDAFTGITATDWPPRTVPSQSEETA